MARNNKHISVAESFVKGDLYTKLSAIFMGAGMIGHKQVVKGLITLACEIAFIFYMIRSGLHDPVQICLHGRRRCPRS